MSFTITRKLEQLPSYPMLCKLAGQNHVHLTGDEHAGSFFCHGVEGNYEFGEGGLRGTFAGHGASGVFSFEAGQVAVTVNEKPFWLPEAFLNQKITDGLDAFCRELV